MDDEQLIANAKTLELIQELMCVLPCAQLHVSMATIAYYWSQAPHTPGECGLGRCRDIRDDRQWDA